MPLVRWLRKPAYWARTADRSAWSNGDFPTTGFIELELDPAGSLSFFEVASREDPLLRRVIADHAIKEQKYDSATCVFLESDAVHQLGIDVRKTPGKNLDPAVKDAHRDLGLLSGTKAIEVLRMLVSQPALEFKKSQVMDFVAESVREKYIAFKDVPAREKLLNALMAENLIDLSNIGRRSS